MFGKCPAPTREPYRIAEAVKGSVPGAGPTPRNEEDIDPYAAREYYFERSYEPD